jgi:hypothetical protein
LAVDQGRGESLMDKEWIMAKSKRYFFSVVEEMIMSPKYDGYRGGRIEVRDLILEKFRHFVRANDTA